MLAVALTQRESESISFIPEFSVDLSRGAVGAFVRVTVTNIRGYFWNNPRNSPLEMRLRLTCGTKFAGDENYSNVRMLEIQSGRIPLKPFAPMYFKIMMFLRPHKLSLGIAAFNIQTDKWMPDSLPHFVDVPSIWTWNNYRIGEEIVFRPESGLITQKARITETLQDNRYKLLYNGKEIECDGSKIYETPSDILCTMILTHDRDDIIKTLLIRRFDAQCVNTYNQIIDGIGCNKEFFNQCELMCQFNRNELLIHFLPICHFMAYNITKFLFEPQVAHSVHCLKSTNHSTPLKFVNGLHYRCEFPVEVQSTRFLLDPRIVTSCDLCSLTLIQWDFFFVDQDTNFNDAHQYCCHCVLNVIKLHKKLKNVLYDVLSEQWSMDLIDEIAHCLIGKVIYSECNALKKSDTRKETQKRTVGAVADYMPIAKRRKLNQIPHQN